MLKSTQIDWHQVGRPAILALVAFTVITGGVYPALVTAIAQVVFPAQANGSLITDGSGNVIGSALIGQAFADPGYFWGRPSATAPVAYNGAASSGSNLGPLNPALVGPDGAVQARIQALERANVAAGVRQTAPIPVDLVTASASGLDPHISPAAALYQAPRVAAVRALDVGLVQSLIAQHTEGRTFWILGEPRVNVLELNLALDAVQPLP